jgi:hypothetical protein
MCLPCQQARSIWVKSIPYYADFVESESGHGRRFSGKSFRAREDISSTAGRGDRHEVVLLFEVARMREGKTFVIAICQIEASQIAKTPK